MATSSTTCSKAPDTKPESTAPENRKIASVAGIIIMSLSNLAFAGMTVLLKKIFLETNITIFEVTYFRGWSLFFFNLAYAKTISVSILDISPIAAKQLLGRVFFGIFAMSTFYLSNKLLPVSLAAALSATDPIFTAIIGWFLFSEKLSRFDIVALVLAFAGVLLIVLNPMRVQSSSEPYNPYYMLVPLFSAVACGFVYNYTRQLAQIVHWIVAPTYFGLGISCIVPIFMFISTSLTMHLTNYTVMIGLLILVMYILGWLGQMLMSKALQIEVAGRVTVINYFQIVLLFASDVVFFHSKINWLDVVGTILIIGCNLTIGILKFLSIIQ